MDNTFVFILTAGACIVGVWAVAQIVISVFFNEKRKIKQRLTQDSGMDTSVSEVAKTITRQMKDSGLPGFLAEMTMLQSLQTAVHQAWPEMSVAKFLVFSGGVGTVLGLVGWAVSGGNTWVGLAALAVGAYFPFFLMSGKRGKRQKMLSDQLPGALDFLSRIMKAGHSLTTGLNMMGEELPKPLAGEFRRAYEQHSLGAPLEDALKDMVHRVNSTDFSFFVTAVLIQRQTGGDLSEVLNNISQMIRDRIRLQNHVKAKTAEGRFTGYVLVAFPALMFVISYMLNRQYAGVLLQGKGLWLLGFAFFLQILGLVVIRRITTVRV